MYTAPAVATQRAPLGSQVSLLDTSATSHQALLDGVPHTGSLLKNGHRAAHEGTSIRSGSHHPDCAKRPLSGGAQLPGAVPESGPPHTSMAAKGTGASGLGLPTVSVQTRPPSGRNIQPDAALLQCSPRGGVQCT
ncbi:hypothetical protein PAL_GLEAN10004092 [Pteropus alecto]|uniref:Uncharacterized protein n=1 Tax=Pteropus alecto TaxID=9402 RepID=L5KAH7_PTEAL|nr:hypothetical protein PAL_GLEAN10004092 [Pteropus alecto]